MLPVHCLPVRRCLPGKPYPLARKKEGACMDYLALVLRWVHLLSAVTLVGGAIFSFLVLRPWLESLPEEERLSVRRQLRGRWAAVVFVGIGLLLVTGLVNIMRINAQLPADLRKTYHPLLGVKVLVALAVFFLASALAGRSEAFQKLRAHWGRTLGLVVLLGVMVVLISGYLRLLRDGAAPSAGEEPAPRGQSSGGVSGSRRPMSLGAWDAGDFSVSAPAGANTHSPLEPATTR